MSNLSGVPATNQPYIECNGLDRFVVSYVGWFPGIYQSHRPWNTEQKCINELFDDAKRTWGDLRFEAVEHAVSRCLEANWIEWHMLESGEFILQRTAAGMVAYGCDSDGAPAYPESTVTDPAQALSILLGILYRAKHDAALRWDPRVIKHRVMDSTLYKWVRHHGVSEEAFNTADAMCQGEGLVRLGFGWPSLMYAITPRGEQALSGKFVLGYEDLMAVWNSLSERKRNSLRALRDADALDADSLLSATEIARRAEGQQADPNGFKWPLLKLTKTGLMMSKSGREGGYWLTSKGQLVLASCDRLAEA